MKLSDLEQINTNCWVYFREGKMVSSALYHQICPGFLACVPCLFCLVDDNIYFGVNMKVQMKLCNQLRCQNPASFQNASIPMSVSKNGKKSLIVMKEKSYCCLNPSEWEPDLLGTFAKPDLELHRSFL